MPCLIMVIIKLVFIYESIRGPYWIRPPKIFLTLLCSKNPILRVRQDTIVLIGTLGWRLLTSLLVPYFLSDLNIRISSLDPFIIIVIAPLLVLVSASTFVLLVIGLL